MNKYITLALVFCISACSQSERSKEVWLQLQFNEFKSIDFSKLGGKEWQKVCFLGPYSENLEKALGFSWRVSEHTDVLMSDGHNVIVFATDTEVLEYVVHSRRYGDFWKLSGQCFDRQNSTLIRDKESGDWKNYVSPKA